MTEKIDKLTASKNTNKVSIYYTKWVTQLERVMSQIWQQIEKNCKRKSWMVW